MSKDIEDIDVVASRSVVNKSSNTTSESRNKVVQSKHRRNTTTKSVSELNQSKPETTLVESIPGTHRIFVKTWGCAHNTSDGEYMAGLLTQYGYHVTTKESEAEEADLWILNSCTVKGPSQDHFLTMTRRAKAKKKKMVVAGCVPQGDKSIEELQGVSVVGVQQIDRIVYVVEETLKGHSVQLYATKRRKDETGKRRKRKDGGASLNLPKIRKNKLIEIIAINTGCLNQCTYCKTKHARGDLGSYSIDDICSRIEQVMTEPQSTVREIWLTSEDTGAYGIDIGTNIAELLRAVMRTLDTLHSHPNKSNQMISSVMVRIGMT